MPAREWPQHRGARAIVGSLAVGVVAFLAVAAGVDQHGARATGPERVELLVVAGAGVNPDGTAGPSLLARTQRAVVLYHAGVADRIAFTGGVGDYGPAEALVGAELAMAAGVPADRIITEATSTSTEENALHLAAIVGPETDILLVTDTYHVWRARRVFLRSFDDVSAVGATSPWPVRLRGASREVVAILWYAISGRLGPAAPKG